MLKRLSIYFIIFSSFAALSGCATIKRISCNSGTAHQKGFATANAGQAYSAGASFANSCAGFDEYNDAQYRQDYKAGYEKGILQYCSKSNYMNWGKADGNTGTLNHTNRNKMSICMNDNRFEALAEKVYKRSFTRAYCSESRVTRSAIARAKSYQKPERLSLGSVCGSNTGHLRSIYKTSYRSALENACQVSAWFNKGTQDAKNGTPMSSGLARSSVCPASMQAGIVSNYTRGYEQQQRLVRQEQELAERRQQLEVDAARERAYQARERERLRRERELRRQDQILSSRSRHRRITPTSSFYFKGASMTATCNMVGRSANVKVYNPTDRTQTVRGNWSIEFYDYNGRLLRQQSTRESLMIFRRDTDKFDYSFGIPSRATQCVARYRG